MRLPGVAADRDGPGALVLGRGRASADRAGARSFATPWRPLGYDGGVKLVLVPAMIFLSGAFMSVAWLGHLTIRQYGFWRALVMSWLIVLPEYVLNVAATRYGYGTFTGAQMASFHLVSGVVCVAVVSRYLLGEPLDARQVFGFGLLAVAMLLVLRPK